MPPPRAEEVEDSDSASDSADSASDSEAAAPVAVAPSAVVTAEAASARAAALAEQLAARTGTVPVEGTASPGRPKETAAPGYDFFLFGRWKFLQVGEEKLKILGCLQSAFSPMFFAQSWKDERRKKM